MPNGFYGPVEEWDRIEAPLQRIDPRLAEFAAEHKMRVEKNYHSWPNRRLLWTTARVEKLIEISLEDDKEATYCLRVTAWEDRDQSRYWKKEMLVERTTVREIEQELESLLQRARELANSWMSDDLEFGGKLRLPK